MTEMEKPKEVEQAIEEKKNETVNDGIKKRVIELSLEEYNQKLHSDKLKYENLRDQIKKEKEIHLRNQKKIMMEWRNIMASLKVDDIIKDFEVFSSEFQRKMDADDAFLTLLDKTLEESNNQYELTLKNHLMHLDRFSTLRESKIKELRTDFSQKLNMLYDEFNREYHNIMKDREDQVS